MGFREPLQLVGLPSDKRSERLILPCLLSAVKPLIPNTGMLQTPAHKMPSLPPRCLPRPSLSLRKPVNSSSTTIIKAFWLITPFNWTIQATRAKWRLVSSAAEQSRANAQTNKQINEGINKPHGSCTLQSGTW